MFPILKKRSRPALLVLVHLVPTPEDITQVRYRSIRSHSLWSETNLLVPGQQPNFGSWFTRRVVESMKGRNHNRVSSA